MKNTMKKLFLSIAMVMLCFTVMIVTSVLAEATEVHEHNYYHSSTWTSDDYECERVGESTYECECGDSYTVPIVALGHQDKDLDGDCDYCDGIFAGDYIYKYVKNDENNEYIFCNEAQPFIGIYRYRGNEINLEIPEKIDDLTVIAIGTEAFRDNRTVEIITIPETVKIIAYQAFEDCRSLRTIVFRGSSQLEKIGSAAFSGCAALENIILGSNITYIGDRAFANCIKIKDIVVPSSVTELGDEVFSMCTSLESVDLQANITKVPECTFLYCYSLKSVNLSDTVDTIGEEAFRYCQKLEKLPLNDNINCLEPGAFILCNAITSVTFKNSDIVIGGAAVGFNVDSSYNEILKRFIDIEAEYQLSDDELLSEELEAELAEIEAEMENMPLAEFTVYGYAGSTAERYVVENNVYGNLNFVDLESECSHTGGKATCEEKAVCELCGEEYGELDDHIPSTYRQEASCSVNGYILTTCEVCLEELDFEILTATGHISGEVVKEKEIEATCESSGSYDEVVYCTECSTEISRNSVTVGPLDHVWDNGSVTTVATCIVKEVITYTCKYNITHTREVIGATDSNNHIGSTYLVGEKAADCTQEGYTGDTYCSDCNKKLSSGRTTPVSGHTFGSWKIDKAATFLEEGLKIRTCTKCTATETETIPRVKGEESKDDDSGITVEYTDDSYDGKEIEVQVEEDFTGSQYIGQSKYGRTESWNIKTYIDGIEVQPNAPVLVKIPLPEGFDPNKVVIYHVNSMDGTLEKITPVYVEDGYIKFLAASFSVYIIVDESSKIEPPHEHSYTASITKIATCTEAGIKTFTCYCNDNYTESIPALGHKDKNGDYKCDNGCGYEYEKPAPEEQSKNCSCNCHKGGFMGFIWKIINFFQKLFKINPVCACGAKHW